MPLSESRWIYLESWIKMSFISGIGPIRLQKLLSNFGTPECILSAASKGMSSCIPEKLAQSIVEQKDSLVIRKKIDAAKGWLDASEAHHIISFDSSYYSPLLRTLPDPPTILYAIGNHKLLSEPQVAIVGSRRPTHQGRRVAVGISEELARSGFVITSGMAMGIDSAAHQGALACYGNTVAVLGTGVDQIYPRTHGSLYSSIIDQGVLVSEYPLGTTPKPSNFPRRNRIISGLSLGVLVVEAAIGSGSLISARLAAEQGRGVFAIPGSVMNPMSKGCHKLIREGAVLVETADDIIADLRPEIKRLLFESNNKIYETISECPTQQKVLLAMGFDVISIDLLLPLCGITYGELSVLLTDMELNGLIESVPGGYIRIS